MTEIHFEEVPLDSVDKIKPDDDVYAVRPPRTKTEVDYINHYICCNDAISLCGLDIRQSDEEAAINPDDVPEDCIVCAAYDASFYHVCPLCGRFR